ncbi:hypothetical protein ABQD78_08470 [Enterococcus gallinarum]|uniref:hypothetical protein n=1 Tax=Enterococcus gallinarum TaxID=1353 RepID=UPI0032E48012
MRFQWLKNYQELEEQILFMKWNLNKSKLELERWVSGDLANVRLEKNSRAASLEENIQIIEKEINRLEEQLNEMTLLIKSFKGLDNQIMYLKYVEGITLEKIAENLNYSTSYIQKKHTESRKAIDFVDEFLVNKSKLKMKISLQDQREKLHKSCTTNSSFKLD